jgi:hypothetical protein
MTYLLMRAWVKDEEDGISCLLLKLEIAQAFTVLISASHLNVTVHRFAIAFVMSQVGDRCSILEESAVAHSVFDAADQTAHSGGE